MDEIIIRQVQNAINNCIKRIHVYTDEYISYLKNISKSDINDIAKEYSQEIFERNYYDELFEELLEDKMELEKRKCNDCKYFYIKDFVTRCCGKEFSGKNIVQPENGCMLWEANKNNV